MLPEDLMIAYQNFTLLATKLGFSYAGLMIGKNPPSLVGIGNVTQKGHELAALLRKYADIVEEKTDSGLVEVDSSLRPN